MSVAKLLNEAKNAAGDQAVQAAERSDHPKAREWRSLAVEINRLFRDAISASTTSQEPSS